VIGCEYATIFAAMGTKVYLVNHSSNILSFLDKELTSVLISEMKEKGVDILFNTAIEGITVPQDDEAPLRIPLKTGEILNVDMLLFAAGRKGNTDTLSCENAGVKIGKRGVVEVNENYQTSASHIYASGDVVGVPALASTSMDQGRVAVSNIFNIGDLQQIAPIFPYGIYTIPEVSTVGITEEQAQEQGLDYCVGRSSYEGLPRGKIMGAKGGFMKVIFT
jgi:NAD(P) transhydrogenase